jgi:hypothetical protein
MLLQTGTEGEGQVHPMRNHEVKIFVNNQAFETANADLTGAQIKALAAIPGDYELFRVEGQNSIPVGNDEHLHLHENEHFRAIPSGTFGKQWHCLLD